MNQIASIEDSPSAGLVDQAAVVADLMAGQLPEAFGGDVVAGLIADQLAGSGWGVTAGLGLDNVHLDALRAEVAHLHGAGELTLAAIGRGQNQQLAPSVRSDRTAWLDGTGSAQCALFQRLEEIRQYLNRTLYLGLTHFEAHFAAFEAGAFYRPHRDSFQGHASRMVSLVLYLNENWRPADGGTLRILGDKGAVVAEVLPKSGHAVYFLSEEVLHEVSPSERTRYSIACWFRADALENLTLLR